MMGDEMTKGKADISSRECFSVQEVLEQLDCMCEFKRYAPLFS